MLIGINATAAIKRPRTGVEEYTYQLIKHLAMLPEAREHRFLLYLPLVKNPSQPSLRGGSKIDSPPLGGVRGALDFSLPSNFEIKILRWPLPFLWTQIRLAWEMLVRPPEALLIPVHILPFFRPKNSIVTIHGLEYEYFPKYYPFWHKLYLRWSTEYALKHARKIIAISENTKRDLIKLCGGDMGKIEVVYHGANVVPAKAGIQNSGSRIKCGMTVIEKPYLLYLGRIETKKNIEGILEAYKILKEKYQIPHQLVLAGAPGYGYDILKLKIENCSDFVEVRRLATPVGDSRFCRSKPKIIETGYISDDEKWQLLVNADIFLFPSFYEGFGLPVLEAQSAGKPVVTSFGSSLPEIVGGGALYVNPQNPTQIAETVKTIIDDNALRDKLIESGYANLKRFSWEKCARKTLEVLIVGKRH